MNFKERLRENRTAACFSQIELAKRAGMSHRTVQNYERGMRMPQSLSQVKGLADALGVTTQYLLGEDGMLVVDATEKGGAEAGRDISQLVTEVSALFAGGELSDEDRDAAMRALNNAYWQSKEINKKYTPKKYQKS